MTEKKKAPTGRKWTVDTHPKREQIIKAIVSGRRSLRNIGKQYGISIACISGFLKEHLLPQAAAAKIKRDLSDGNKVLDEIDYVMDKMRKLYQACNEYLTDPTNKERYELGPRGDQIDVVYIDASGDMPVRRKETLQAIFDRLAKKKITMLETKSRYADPRKLIIDTAAVLTKQLETIAKIHGLIKEGVNINITQIKQWPEIKTIIIDATKDAPDIKKKIIHGLAQIVGS